MSDEEITPTEAEQEEATPTTPELTDDAVLAYLNKKYGKEFTPKELERLNNLDEMAKEVNRARSEIGRAKKAAPAPTDDDEVDIDSIDPKTRKLLKKFVEQEFGAALSLPNVMAEDEVNEAIDEFTESHKDVPPELLGEVIAELEAVGAGPKKPTKRETTKFLKVAYDIARARTLDTDAIKAAAKQDVLAELAKQAKEKGEVVAVEKKSGVSDKVDADAENASKGFWDRI